MIDKGILDFEGGIDEFNALPERERNAITAQIGSMFEYPLEEIGAIREVKSQTPPEDVIKTKLQDPYKREISSPEWYNLLSADRGTGLSFARPHKWTKAQQGGDRLIKTFDRDLLKNLTEEKAPRLFDAVNYLQLSLIHI